MAADAADVVRRLRPGGRLLLWVRLADRPPWVSRRYSFGQFCSDGSNGASSVRVHPCFFASVKKAGLTVRHHAGDRRRGRGHSGATGLGTALAASGVDRPTRVGLVIENHPVHVSVLVALLARGHTVVTLSPLQPPDRLARDVADARPTLLVATRAGLTSGSLQGPGLIALDDAGNVSVESGPAAPIVSATDGVALEIFTSGTTGTPKRIPLGYGQLDASLSSSTNDAHDDPALPPLRSSVQIVATPLVHISGLWATIAALCAGRQIVLLPRFSTDTWLDVVRLFRPKVVSLVPAALRSVLDTRPPREELASIRAVTTGTAPCPPDVIDRALAEYGIRVLPTYGATEYAGSVAGWTFEDHTRWWPKKRGAVGRAFRGVELRICTEDGQPVPAGEPGVLAVRAAQLGGVLGDWVRTNDRGRLDADGFLWIVGRADDVIIRGGFKVHPATVQAALERHPGVREAAVVGIPDDRLGAVPVASVELVPGRSATADELRDWARETLSPYEVPKRIVIVPEIPRTPSLKVDRGALRSMFEATGPGLEFQEESSRTRGHCELG